MTSSPTVIEVARWLTAKGRDPQTIAAYLAHEERTCREHAEQAVLEFLASAVAS